MKRIIDSKTYNTDTAIRIVYRELGYDGEGEELFQNRHGAFFLVIITEIPGVGDLYKKIEPLTDGAAQAYLEKYDHDGDLVERYFGEFPEAGAAEPRLNNPYPRKSCGSCGSCGQGKGSVAQCLRDALLRTMRMRSSRR